MRRFLPCLPALLVVGAGLALAATALAQEQEEGMLARIFERARSDSKVVNPMQDQEFRATNFRTREYGANDYGGVKAANIKTFTTRSFLGVKNPWFGRKVFEASASALGARSARESRETYRTEASALRDATARDPRAAAEATTALPTAAQPRPFLVKGETQAGLDRFTEDLQKDLTIDDVRALLNKGPSD